MKYKNIATLASRLADVKPSATLALTEKARELAAAGKDVVSLTAGEPDFPPAAHIIEGTKAALDKGATRYTHVGGVPQLREAIQQVYAQQDGLHYELNEIVVSTGAKQAVYNAMQALLDPGDEVIIVAPYWLSYRDIVVLADGVAVIVDTDESTNFILPAERLAEAITDRTKAIILNSPSNPTGATYDAAQLAAIAAVIERHPKIVVIADEIYRRFTYGDGDAPSLLRVAPDLQDRVLVIDGCSKTYAMTGFRIGWTAGPRNIISAMSKIQGQSTSNPAAPSQFAALAALTGDQTWVDEMVRTFDIRRKFVVGRLNAMPGVRCFDPTGAFYVFPNFGDLVGRQLADGTEIRDAFTICAHLLHEHHLVVVPGQPFGAPNNIRMSFATDSETLAKGLDRLQTAIQALG